MFTQRTSISVLIAVLIAFASQSAASADADVVMMPNTRASELVGLDRDAMLRERLACPQPVSQQVRENLAPSTQNNRAHLDAARPDPGSNLPSGELTAPHVFALVQIPLGRTATLPPSPNLESAVKTEQTSLDLDLPGDPLHLRLTDPLPNELC